MATKKTESTEAKNVYEALSQARKAISETKMAKKGRNSYSNYDYFTPDQVHSLVEKASQETNLLALFNLSQDELGYYGSLEVLHYPTDTKHTFTLRTAIPEIKATNAAQKLGGMMTYTERYMKMSAFGIVDNNLDFDSQDNRGEKSVSKPDAKKSALKIIKGSKSSGTKLTDANTTYCQGQWAGHADKVKEYLTTVIFTDAQWKKITGEDWKGGDTYAGE